MLDEFLSLNQISRRAGLSCMLGLPGILLRVNQTAERDQ
jgi:hypothetical protein